jgi:uncharacterized damage-inducible protein DinB
MQSTVKTTSSTRARMLLPALLLCLLAPAAGAAAQDNPFSTWHKSAYSYVQAVLLRAADKMPEESYNFKPTDAVRSFGQVVGHVADSQYLFCSIALGEKNPSLKIEETKTSKADLTAALKAAFAYCDKAYASMNDTSGAQLVKLMGGDTPRLNVLTVNMMHSLEHYGNIVTYLRLKNIVPPTSEPGFMPQPKK